MREIFISLFSLRFRPYDAVKDLKTNLALRSGQPAYRHFIVAVCHIDPGTYLLTQKLFCSIHSSMPNYDNFCNLRHCFWMTAFHSSNSFHPTSFFSLFSFSILLCIAIQCLIFPIPYASAASRPSPRLISGYTFASLSAMILSFLRWFSLFISLIINVLLMIFSSQVFLNRCFSAAFGGSRINHYKWFWSTTSPSPFPSRLYKGEFWFKSLSLVYFRIFFNFGTLRPLLYDIFKFAFSLFISSSRSFHSSQFVLVLHLNSRLSPFIWIVSLFSFHFISSCYWYL